MQKISSAKYFATKIDNAKNLLMYGKSAKYFKSKII